MELEQPEVGRVIRFDSLSKILSSGIRIGFACGPEAIMTAIDMHVSPCNFHRNARGNTKVTSSQTAVANLQTSSLTQAITFALLDSWGYDNFKAHTHAVSQFYKGKRDVFERLMKKHLDGLAQWDTPEAGMFFWCVRRSFTQV